MIAFSARPSAALPNPADAVGSVARLGGGGSPLDGAGSRLGSRLDGAAGSKLAGAAVSRLAGGIAERVRQQFAADGMDATPAAVVTAVRRETGAAVLGDTAVLRLADQIHDQLVGAGPLAPLLADPTVTDVLVNGVQVWVDRGAGLQREAVSIGDADDVRRLAQRLAASCGRRLDDGQPYADARLPDGTRLHAVLPPVATTGPYLSLRTFRQRPFSLDDLVGQGTVPATVAPVLSAIVAARLAYLVAGGTGSGKTTLLGTLLGLVPPTERIVLVEDAAELRPLHPHVVALQARTSNVEGAGAIGLTDLVRQALRMRPDRLIVGECRGAEIVDLLGALNTGHDGGAGTLHANSAADVPARLEALGMLGGLPRAALHAQILAALQVVLHVRRSKQGRLLESISVLLPAGEQHLATVVPAWQRGHGPGPSAEALASLIARRGVRVPAILEPPDSPRPQLTSRTPSVPGPRVLDPAGAGPASRVMASRRDTSAGGSDVSALSSTGVRP
jgi:pilus assembly protein CpaF